MNKTSKKKKIYKKNSRKNSKYFEIKNTINAIFDSIVFEEIDIQPILDLLIHDKKNEYGKIQFALLDGIGSIKINQEVENELIIKSFEDSDGCSCCMNNKLYNNVLFMCIWSV
jgi:3-dehydroquinate synthetase